HIAGMMRLSKSKLQYVFMAIIFFFVVQRGYYPLVADYSMFAFIVLLIWGAWDFITGRKNGKSSSGNDMGTYNMGVNNPGKRSVSGIVRDNITRKLKSATGLTNEAVNQQYQRAIEEGRGHDARNFQQVLQANERNGNTGFMSKLKRKK
ncbi:MAG: hypothetical protein KAT83_02890, partial [Candidatus Aenigmarchaeota archaeon]|nr:hypothetical protein [Candidatus Aenigmarchaeota archaeon]